MISSRNIRLLLAIIILAGIVFIMVAIFLKGSKRVSPEPISQPLPRNIDIALNNALFTEMRDGKALWELVAERAEYDKTGDTAYLTGIKMKFAKTATAGTITVTAAKGEYSTKNKDVKLRGKVHVITDDGVTFDSESIDYQAAHSRFTTDAAVTFRQQRLALGALGMFMDVTEQKAHFKSAAHATIDGWKSR